MLSIGVHECQYWLSLRCVAFYIVCMVLKASQPPTARPAARLLSSSSSASSSAEEERYEAHSTRSVAAQQFVVFGAHAEWGSFGHVPTVILECPLQPYRIATTPADKAKSSVQLLVNFTGCHLTPHYYHHHHCPINVIVLGKSPQWLVYDRHCLVGLLTDLHMLLFLSLFLLSFTTLPTIPVVDQFFMNIGNLLSLEVRRKYCPQQKMWVAAVVRQQAITD